MISKNSGATLRAGSESDLRPGREILHADRAAGIGSKGLRLAAITIGALWLCFLWQRNHNLLGDFYDYSILTSASGYLEHGLKVYRDFSSPLQSLTIYLAWFAEMVFGHRYLALGYANLVLGLVAYFGLLRALKNRLPPLMDVLVAAAFCASTVFQHGILFYNPLAMVLLAFTTLCVAEIYAGENIRRGRLVLLCALLFLSSMCKLNFHLLACAMIGGILSLCLLKRGWPKPLVLAIPALFVCGVVLGPLTEVLLNHVSLHEWFYDVVRTPTSRARLVHKLSNPNLFLGKFWDYYPFNWSAGIYLKAGLIYAFCAGAAFFKAFAPADPEADGHSIFRSRFLVPICLAGFYSVSLALTISNVETQMLTSTFVLIGLTAAFVMFRGEISALQGWGFKAGIALLAAYFFIAGSASAFMHSRVYYGHAMLTESQPRSTDELEAAEQLKSDQIPLYDASSISPKLNGYFAGVRLTELGRARLTKIFSFIDTNHLEGHLKDVYWGPGLEMLNRLEDTVPKGRFPLWYHTKTSVRPEHGPYLAKQFEHANYEWIITTDKISEMTADVRDYIHSHYDQSGDEDILIFHRKP